MKIYIWNEVEKCSDSYHANGGVVVVAESEQQARTQANLVDGCVIDENEKADYVYDLAGSPETNVFIFPNAGCC